MKDPSMMTPNEFRELCNRTLMGPLPFDTTLRLIKLTAYLLADSWDELFDDMGEWQDETFPTVSAASAVEHIKREVLKELWPMFWETYSKRGALYERPRDEPLPGHGEEFADLVFLIKHAAKKAGVDLQAEVEAKLRKNMTREWQEPDAHGVVHHVKEGEAAPCHIEPKLYFAECSNCMSKRYVDETMLKEPCLQCGCPASAMNFNEVTR